MRDRSGSTGEDLPVEVQQFGRNAGRGRREIRQDQQRDDQHTTIYARFGIGLRISLLLGPKRSRSTDKSMHFSSRRCRLELTHIS